MQVTSAEANKMLRKLFEDHKILCERERTACVFVAATIEKPEDARPQYDYAETQRRLAETERKIRALKHAVNLFNAGKTLQGFDLTIDQALIYIPQLTKRAEKLSRMRAVPAKERYVGGRSTNLIEYRYANYGIAEADADYRAAADELARLQNALDLVNSTVKFEIGP